MRPIQNRDTHGAGEAGEHRWRATTSSPERWRPTRSSMSRRPGRSCAASWKAKARAMVVTNGIERAIQYCHAISDYLKERKSRVPLPGCQARHCDAHHVRHWAAGGATRLDNLVRLCRAITARCTRKASPSCSTPTARRASAGPMAGRSRPRRRPRAGKVPRSHRALPSWRPTASRSIRRPGPPTGTASAWTKSGQSTSCGGPDRLRRTLVPIVGRVPGRGHELSVVKIQCDHRDGRSLTGDRARRAPVPATGWRPAARVCDASRLAV